jgi:ABC-type nitrate/sulfonate/bicarbonate transport system ATPase subunit
MDEPFSALDVQTRTLMEDELLQLWSSLNASVVFVTHDLEEALYLSDEVHVMATRPGRVIEAIAVAIERPRLRRSTMTREFLAAKERCLELLAANRNSTLLEEVA